MTTISATTILRSRHALAPDKVLSTLLLRYPRCIHAEFMTHRQFSRNAASSRAIPVSKLIQDVIDDPFVPLYWGANQKGMQAEMELDAHVAGMMQGDAWLLARNNAVMWAKNFAEAGYHKQICNRLLEPYAHITVLVSSTEWSNFLALRDHKDAEPHIAMLAREVRKCIEREDDIQILQPSEWHLPFITESDWAQYNVEELKMKSIACCASTSYKTVDGFEMTMETALRIADKLLGSTPLHASPAEHVAMADNPDTIAGERYWLRRELHGNFEGFCQFRKTLPNECL